MKYGQETFKELELLAEAGYTFGGILHSIDVLSCSDWKAAACIEGN